MQELLASPHDPGVDAVWSTIAQLTYDLRIFRTFAPLRATREGARVVRCVASDAARRQHESMSTEVVAQPALLCEHSCCNIRIDQD